MKRRGKCRTAIALTALTLASAVTITGCSGPGQTQTETESPAQITAGPAGHQQENQKQPDSGQISEGPADYTDNFYDAVNHTTLESWEIPDEQADMSWFRKAREDNYIKVNDLISQASSTAGQAGQETGSDLYNIRALNLTGLDRETRDREGYGSGLCGGASERMPPVPEGYGSVQSYGLVLWR